MRNFFNNIKNIHFIGIGGISMSALAHYCLNMGMNVSGSDRANSETINNLKNAGVKIYLKHKSENIHNNLDMVVFTSAVSEQNCELVTAQKKCKIVLERADFLNLIASQYKTVIAVSGTHGKTTTCGMLASVFYYAGLNPTAHIGGIINQFNSNYLIGANKYFITEACEYKKHLLKLKPTISAVLNVEPDHMECYKNLNHLKNCFIKFQKTAKFSIWNSNDKIKKHINYLSRYVPINVTLNENGCYSFSVVNESTNLNINLSVVGKHNINNALCAIAICKLCGIGENDIEKGLNNFKGVKRRFEVLGKLNNCNIIRDYAHHPTEIQSTINTLKELNKPYVIIFQPHTYSRTLKLLNDFKELFNKNNNIIIYKTYSARESKSMGLSAKELCNQLNNVTYIGTKTKLKKVVNELSQKNINVVFVGAGDIGEIAQEVLS